MNTSQDPTKQTDLVPQEHVPPLTQTTVDGKPLVRRADVENEISCALATDPATWIEKAQSLSSEAIVHLICTLRVRGEDHVCGCLVKRIGRRIARIAKDWAKGFDQITTDEIVIQVGKEVISLILAETPNRQSEFLEISFKMAVKRRTLNQVEKLTHHPLTHQFVAPAVDMLEDECPNPEEIAVAAEALTLNQELIRAGLAAIKDSRHREAVILHYLEGWPITDKNPHKPTLCTHFRITARQISTWMKTALAEMRQAIGDKYDQ